MKKIKNQKPIEIDAQFKFICPNSNCRFDHWLSLNQCKTKHFKVVCDCGNIFIPKRMLNIKIVYPKKHKIEKPVSNDIVQIKDIKQAESCSQIVSPNNNIPDYLKTTSIKILAKYGFTEKEGEDLVIMGYQKNPIDNVAIFVRYILENIQLLEKK